MMSKKKVIKKKVTRKKVGKRKTGRPTKYKPEFNERAYRACLNGATDQTLAKRFGISESTLNEWKIKFPEFSESIQAGKEKADDVIAEAVFDRAKGYSHSEEKIFCKDGEVTRVQTTKHYPPDPVTATFWLKNRNPEKWREKQALEVTQRPYSDMSLEELTQLRERLERERAALAGETQ